MHILLPLYRLLVLVPALEIRRLMGVRRRMGDLDRDDEGSIWR